MGERLLGNSSVLLSEKIAAADPEKFDALDRRVCAALGMDPLPDDGEDDVDDVASERDERQFPPMPTLPYPAPLQIEATFNTWSNETRR